MMKLPPYARPIYVADHVLRIEGEHAGDRLRLLDSKWRIAEYCDLIEGLGDRLTSSEEVLVDAFIAEFKASEEGNRALKEVAEAIALGYRSEEVQYE